MTVCIQSRPISRGYAAVGLCNPKFGGNIGASMRAAFCYGASLVAISGQRFRREQPDTPHAWKHIPTLEVSDILDALPYDCTPVAVDILPEAVPLPNFRHPERAFYIFGPEDGTLDRSVTERCTAAVVVPTNMCMNLGATVNVVLYDRAAKRYPQSLLAGRKMEAA